MTEEKFSFLKLLKLKYRRGDQIIQVFCRIGSLQEITLAPVNFLEISKVWEGYSGIK